MSKYDNLLKSQTRKILSQYSRNEKKKIMVTFEIFSAGKFDGIRFSYNSD